MKELLFFILGFIPLVASFPMESMVSAETVDAKFYWLIALGFYIFWGVLGFIAYDKKKIEKHFIIFIHFPAFLCLVLIFVQDVILNSYWLTTLGVLTQLFYSVMNHLSEKIVLLLKIPFSTMNNLFVIYLVSFILMFVSFLAGVKLKVGKKPAKAVEATESVKE